MKTAIEKYKDVFDIDTCNKIVKIIEANLDQARDNIYSKTQSVICKELMVPSVGLRDFINKEIHKVLTEYQIKYRYWNAFNNTGLQLRKITGATKEHVDVHNIVKSETSRDTRNVSVIIGLNSDYEEGTFHFPYQDYTTTVKQGEAIVFPVWFMYPHYVDAPIGYRYTINTWYQY